MSKMIATERLFLTADKTRAVHTDDPDAAFLLAAEGREIPGEYEDLVIALDVADINGSATDPADPNWAPPPATKEVKPAPNKAEPKPRTKGRVDAGETTPQGDGAK